MGRGPVVSSRMTLMSTTPGMKRLSAPAAAETTARAIVALIRSCGVPAPVRYVSVRALIHKRTLAWSAAARTACRRSACCSGSRSVRSVTRPSSILMPAMPISSRELASSLRSSTVAVCPDSISAVTRVRTDATISRPATCGRARPVRHRARRTPTRYRRWSSQLPARQRIRSQVPMQRPRHSVGRAADARAAL